MQIVDAGRNAEVASVPLFVIATSRPPLLCCARNRLSRGRKYGQGAPVAGESRSLTNTGNYCDCGTSAAGALHANRRRQTDESASEKRLGVTV